MPVHHHNKQFLKLPIYTGGSEAFRKFIAANLRYPEAAMEARVEGTVIVEYDIHDNGLVQHPRVLKGIGYGCDAEAMRLVSMLCYEKVKNRGMRVKMTTKTSIRFRLPKTVMSYTVSYTQEPEKTKVVPKQKNSDPVMYDYTIQL